LTCNVLLLLLLLLPAEPALSAELAAASSHARHCPWTAGATLMKQHTAAAASAAAAAAAARACAQC
jgi:hypothetical protein